jgi:hypothetical protein
VILFCDAPRSISRIQLAQHCEKFLDDQIFLSIPYVIPSDVSPEAFTRFMKILDCFEPYFCPETFDDSMLLA